MLAYRFCMMDTKEYRNVVLNRLHRNPVRYLVTRMLFKPLDSLLINMPPVEIGGAVLSARLFNDCGSERNWRVLRY